MCRRWLVTIALAAAALAAIGVGCRDGSSRQRRDAAKATAVAEEHAREATLTGANVESPDSARDIEEQTRRVNEELVGAFRLEQADFRAQLQPRLDALDESIAQPGDAVSLARRDLLKSDLDAVNRSTEPDWATVRAKVERDLAAMPP